MIWPMRHNFEHVLNFGDRMNLQVTTFTEFEEHRYSSQSCVSLEPCLRRPSLSTSVLSSSPLLEIALLFPLSSSVPSAEKSLSTVSDAFGRNVTCAMRDGTTSKIATLVGSISVLLYLSLAYRYSLPAIVSALQHHLASGRTAMANIDSGWHAPSSSWITDLTAVINGTGVHKYVFNSSSLPDSVPYGTYNWCNMACIVSTQVEKYTANLPSVSTGTISKCFEVQLNASCVGLTQLEAPRPKRRVSRAISRISTPVRRGGEYTFLSLN